MSVLNLLARRPFRLVVQLLLSSAQRVVEPSLEGADYVDLHEFIQELNNLESVYDEIRSASHLIIFLTGLQRPYSSVVWPERHESISIRLAWGSVL